MASVTRASQTAGAMWLVPALTAALLSGAGLGLAVGLGVSTAALVVGLLAPFALLLMLARPDWAVIAYAVLVYADLLSVLVREHGMPPLARFAGVALLAAVVIHRLIARREGLVSDPMTGWLLAYGVVVALGIFYARQPDLVVSNLVEFARNFILFLVVINTLTTQGRVRRALWALLMTGTFLAALTLWQALIGQYSHEFGGLAVYRASEIVGGNDAPRPGGTLGDANYYGQSLLILVPIGLYLFTTARAFTARVAGAASSLILIAAVIFTYSRGDAVALGAVLGAALIYKRPKLKWIAAGVVVLAFLVPLVPQNYFARIGTLFDVVRGDSTIIYTEESIRGRAGATQAAVDMFLDHPIVGVGREHYPLYQLEYLSGNSLAYKAKGIPPHNLYLEVAAEHGLLGIVTLGGIIVLSWRALIDSRRRFLRARDTRGADLAAWLAIAFFGYLVSALSLHGAFPAYLWLQVAIIAALYAVARRASPDVREVSLPNLAPLSAVRPTYNEPESEEPQGTLRLGALRALIAQRLEETREVLQSTRQEASGSADTMSARLGLWLDAADAARRRGDLMTARALIEAVLERDPDNRRARQGVLRLRITDRLLTTSPRLSLSMIPDAPPTPLHRVADEMRAFYLTWGGDRLFGPPISPLFVEATPTGEAMRVQYFTYARLELASSSLPGITERIDVAKLGLEVKVHGELASPLPEGLRGQPVYVGRGHIGVPWKFAIFWELNGREQVIGMPLSPPLLQTLPDGEAVAVQYFERACLEYHPHAAGTPDEVQLSRLGAQVFDLRYGKRR